MGERSSIRRLILDAGALIAFERGDAWMRSLLGKARVAEVELIIPAGALGQAWRDGRRQVALRTLLRSAFVRVEALTGAIAMAAGELCARRGTNDIIDASIAIAARRVAGTVVTSDPSDIRQLDPTLRIRGV